MANRGRESASARTHRIPIALYEEGDEVLLRHWSGYHFWTAKLLEVNSKWALLDLGPQQGTVQFRLNATNKFKAGSPMKGMKGWHIDVGQIERLKATARQSAIGAKVS